MKHYKITSLKHYITVLLTAFTFLTASAQKQTMGLFVYEDNAFNGYALMSNNEITYLIDNCGLVVNTWESNYKTGHGIYILKNGDLLRAGRLEGNFAAGGVGGIFEIFDWEGNLKWSYTIATESEHAHHDLAPLPNGNFLCTVWEKHSEAEAKEKGRKYNGDMWSTKIYELKPIIGTNQTEVVWEWSAWDHLIQDHDSSKNNYGIIANNPEKIDINYLDADLPSFGNWMHCNAIDYNEKFDQIVISSRFLSEIYVIDHSTTKAEAASGTGGKYGKGGDLLYRYGNPQVYDNGDENDRELRGQHDIRWIPADHKFGGHFSVFNNEFIAGQQSRVQIFRNPADENGFYNFDQDLGFGDDDILYSYTNSTLHSDILSSVQSLPNDNLLILEGRSGLAFEIDENENIVWEYVFPVNRNGGPGIQGGTPQFNSIFKCNKYSPDYEGFFGKELIGTIPIELSPLSNDCFYSSIDEKTLGIDLVNSLVQSTLFINIDIDTPAPYNLQLFNTNQQLVYKTSLSKGQNSISLDNLNKGFYIAFISVNGNPILIEKLIKN